MRRNLSRKEIKYDDDYFNVNQWTPSGLASGGLQAGYLNWVLGGILQTSQGLAGQISNYPGGVNGQGGNIIVNDTVNVPNCLTNIDSGTTAKTRIGNMIAPRFITIKGVLSAARTVAPTDAETIAKTEPGTDEGVFIPRFMRTSIKLFVIRDRSMNEKGYVTYNDVFESSLGEGGFNSDTNPFLWNRKVDTIGRYEIVKEYGFELDQDDPQQAFSYTIPLLGKNIRYNGNSNTQYVEGVGMNNLTTGTWAPLAAGGVTPVPVYAGGRALARSAEQQSMTNGIYILAVAHSTVLETLDVAKYSSPAMVFTSRLTFEDN